MTWNMDNGAKALTATFADLIAGSMGVEKLVEMDLVNGSTADTTADVQFFNAALSMNFDMGMAIPVAVGDPISRKNIVLKVGDVLRARKAGETVTANWSVIVRSTS